MLHRVEREGAREIGTPPCRESRGGAAVALAQVFPCKLGPAVVEAEQPRRGSHPDEVASSVAEPGKDGRRKTNDRRDQAGPAHREPERHERPDGVTDHHQACAVGAQVLQAVRDCVGVVVGTITGVGTARSTKAEEVGNNEPPVVGKPVEGAAPIVIRRPQSMEQDHHRRAIAVRSHRKRLVTHSSAAGHPCEICGSSRESHCYEIHDGIRAAR
jgi:hypothetical protein